MALMPRDLKLNNQELAEVAKYEKVIDEALQKVFQSGRKDYVVELGDFLSTRISNELIYRYTTGDGTWSRAEYANCRFFLTV